MYITCPRLSFCQCPNSLLGDPGSFHLICYICFGAVLNIRLRISVGRTAFVIRRPWSFGPARSPDVSCVSKSQLRALARHHAGCKATACHWFACCLTTSPALGGKSWPDGHWQLIEGWGQPPLCSCTLSQQRSFILAPFC